MGTVTCGEKCLYWIYLLAISSFAVFEHVQAENSCKRGCTKSVTGFLKYVPGNVYEYSYDSVMTVAVGATSGEETDDTSLKVSGSAKIFVEGNCGFILQLNAVKITALKEGTIEKRLLQSINKPVRFSLTDGYAEPEICVDSSEDVFSLNIKRGVISLLISSKEKENELEVDVFGQCPTHTAVSSKGSTEIITKMRNLNECAHREQIVSGIIQGVVNEKSGVKSVMLLQADYAKEVKVENGILEYVHLTEDYFFAGTQKSFSDVRAKVVTNMKYKSTSSAPAPAVGNKKSSIMFQKPDVYPAKNLATLKAIITDIVQKNGEYVQKDSAKQFAELIRLMRNSDAEGLLELASVPFPNKVLARKVYLDALFRTATSESARAIIKQFGKFSEVEKSISLLSLNLVQVVDKETINQAAALLSPSVPQEAYLAVSNLLVKYCSQQNCENAPEVQATYKKFTEALKHCKANTKKDEERIVYVLKGLANANGLAKTVIPSLTECASTGRSLRIRISALHAFSAAGCENEIRQNALELLKNHNEDSELRIEAYLAAVQCPTAELANEIAEIVNNEKVNQVGGFLTSHLRAIRDSTDAHRESLRHFLGNIRITRKFPQDIRRFSYNNELSYRLDALGVSASADYKLIYSQHGFLPRSARLNVTSEIFGMNFNLLEAGFRQDNLENVLEYYFGPKGLLNKDFDDILKASGASGVPRARRSIADESEKFSKKYKTYGTKNADELNLDLSLKLFGSEMLFLSLGDNIPSTLDDIIQTFSSGFDYIKKEVSNFQKELIMHTLFIDTELLYPTGVGMPLEISIQGLSANKFDLKLSIDIDAILEQNWQRAKYNLKVVPSVDLNINFRVGFNAYVISTGLRLSSSLHSATGADFTLAFINDNGFTMDVQVPREKLELLHMQTESEFYVGEQDKQIKTVLPKSIKQSKSESSEMCFDQLKPVGLTVCFYSTPIEEHGHFNWLQPREAGLYVNTEKNYHIKGNHIPQTSTGTKQWRLDFSTPGSTESHDTSLAFELGIKPRVFGRLSLDYPQVHFALEAGINNDQRELVAYAQYEQNDNVHKNRIGFEKHGNEYRPVISIQDKTGNTVNEINGYRADGRVLVQQIDEKSARYNFENFKIINNENKHLIINGWTEVGPAMLKAELSVRPGEHAFIVKSHYKIQNGVYEVSTFVADEKSPKNLMGASLHLKLSDAAVGIEVVGKANFWEVLAKTNLEYVKADGFSALTSSKFDCELSAKHKEKNFASLALDGFTEGRDKFGINARLARGKHTGSLITKFQTKQHSQNDFLLEVNAKLNNHFVDLIARCDVIGNQFNVENVFTSSWGTAFSAKGHLGQRYTPQDILIDLYGTAQLSSKEKPSEWLLKVNGFPEKTTSEFKLIQDNQELIKYNGESAHPQDKIMNFKGNLNVKNVFNTKVDYKVAKNGKGEFNAQIDTLRSDAKHKIDLNSKFHVQTPKYDIETTLLFDGDKKIYLKTENQIDKTKISTKTVGEIAKKRVTLDMNIQLKGSDLRTNGELTGTYNINIPTGHILDGSFERKITTNAKTGLSQGHIDFQLNEHFGDKKRSITYNAKLDKLNIKTKDIAIISKIIYSNSENKKINIDYHLKHDPIGNEKYKVDFKVNAGGDALPFNPSEVSVLVNEYDVKHAVIALNLKYGSENQLSVNGNYKIGSKNTPSTYDIKADLQVPRSEFKSFEINSSGKYLKPESDEGTGSHVMEMQINQKIGNGKFLKLHTSYNGTPQQCSYSFDMQTESMTAPFKIDGSYQREQSLKDQNLKYVFSSSIIFGEKYFKTSGDISKNNNIVNTHFILKTSIESVKSIDVTLLSEKSNTDSNTVKAQLKLNNQIYALTSQLYHSSHKKGVELDIVTPQSPNHILVVTIIELLGENKGKISAEISNLAGIDLKANIEAAYKDLDNFYITGSWNSERFNLKNYAIDFKSQNKAIILSLNNSDGIIMNGKVAYVLKKEGNKSYIEGQGQVHYKGKPHNTNFKLIRQIYDAVADKEVGFSYTFNGNFGPKNGVSTLKITNKDLNIKVSVCEEKKQCNNVQVQSLIASLDGSDISLPLESIQHSLLVLVDFRELGYPYEFELQSKTIRQGFKLQYSLDSNIISNNNHKYQLIANIVPKSSKVQIRLPSREIVLETLSEYPESGLFGKYRLATEFYFDKTRKANEVTRLDSTVFISGIENGLTALNTKGEIRFEHPNIRPISILGRADFNREEQFFDAEINFDIFSTPEQKLVILSHIQNVNREKGFNITTNQQIRSSVLALQYNFNAHTAYDVERHEVSMAADLQTGQSDIAANIWFLARRNHMELDLRAFNQPIVRIGGDLNQENNYGKLQAQLQFFSQSPIELQTEVQPSFAKLEFKRQNVVNGNVELHYGKELKLSVNGAGNPLVEGKILLDSAHFLETTYSSHEENFKKYMEFVDSEIKKETQLSYEQINNIYHKFQENAKRQIQLLKKSFPDHKHIASSFNKNLMEIYGELEQDPALKHIIEIYRELYNKFVKVAEEVSKTVLEAYEQMQKSLTSLYEQFDVLINETVLPIWKKFLVDATKIIENMRSLTIKLFGETLQSVLSLAEEYGPPLKNYGKALYEAFKPYHQGVQELYKSIANVIEEIYGEITEWISQLPSFDVVRKELKEKIEKLNLSEKVLEFVNVLFEQLYILPTTQETHKLLEHIRSYIEAKLKGQVVNDNETVDELFKLLIKALRSLLSTIETSFQLNLPGTTSSGLQSFLSALPYYPNVINWWSGLFTLRLSAFNYIINEDWSSAFNRESLRTLIAFHDFDLHGHIADGRHIFTYDGQYFAFHGNCKYILAQDSKDNNFTVIAQLNNGKLKNLILSDREGNFLEITDSGSLKFNANPAEYPLHESNSMHAWRKYYTIWLLSEYGVEIMCTSDLKVCHIKVNGFYTGKMRGLLGNGNAEPHDDFTQVDGTIAASSTTFGNNYGVGKCSPVQQEPKTEIVRSEICNGIFGIESPLAYWFLVKDYRTYREACDQAVLEASEKEKETAACNIALAYGSAVAMEYEFSMLPAMCLKCPGSAGQRELYQEFTVKIPNNKADIVFVVDAAITRAAMSNLVAPAITEIRDSLKTRGFSDVQIGVIAYNESQRYPALLTSDNGKLNYNGNLAHLELNGPKNFCDNCLPQIVTEKYVLEIYEFLENIVKGIVPQSDELAFELALNFPFRAGAAKSIIDVRSKSLENGNVFKWMRAHVAEMITKLDGVVLHLLSPVKEMSLEGVPVEKLIGFNSRLVATLDGKDAKKRPKLKFETDTGIDFALNTGGWVFATQNIENLKPNDQKKALNQVVNSIADTLFKTEIVSDCKCLPVHGLHAQHVCVVKSSNFVPNKKPKA